MADYLIDMGTEGGKGGGELLSYGTPEEVVKSTKAVSYTHLFEDLHEQRTANLFLVRKQDAQEKGYRHRSSCGYTNQEMDSISK